MIKELKYFFFLVIILAFIFLTIKYYFSDTNYKKSYRSISQIDNKIKKLEKELIFLENDTIEIVEYLENNKVKKKKVFILGTFI